jgi:deoxyhypusine synthase
MKNPINNIDPIEKEFVNNIGDEYSNSIEAEIDAIRIALYEKTKGMTIQEFHDHIGKEIAPIYERLGIKPVSSIVDWKPSKVIKKSR